MVRAVAEVSLGSSHGSLVPIACRPRDQSLALLAGRSCSGYSWFLILRRGMQDLGPVVAGTSSLSIASVSLGTCTDVQTCRAGTLRVIGMISLLSVANARALDRQNPLEPTKV